MRTWPNRAWRKKGDRKVGVNREHIERMAEELQGGEPSPGWSKMEEAAKEDKEKAKEQEQQNSGDTKLPDVPRTGG
jgi:hypothetical protein